MSSPIHFGEVLVASTVFFTGFSMTIVIRPNRSHQRFYSLFHRPLSVILPSSATLLSYKIAPKYCPNLFYLVAFILGMYTSHKYRLYEAGKMLQSYHFIPYTSATSFEIDFHLPNDLYCIFEINSNQTGLIVNLNGKLLYRLESNENSLRQIATQLENRGIVSL